ncbi:MAG: hypothetical protein AAB869_03510, partial [Patescibacteria group bacterium]
AGSVERPSVRMGFLTLEIMIALVLVTLSISAVVLVTFGNQALLVGGETNAEATQKAEEILETAQSLARQDFHTLNPRATSTTGIYRSSLSVELLSPLDYFSKKITAYVAWTDERHIPHEVSLTSIMTDFLNATGGDTCSSVVIGNWLNPQVASAMNDLGTIPGIPPGTYTVGDIDAYKEKLYVAVSKTTSANHPTLFIFDVSNPASLTLLGATDTAPTLGGINGIRVAPDVTTGKLYAYLASSGLSRQLQVIDVSNPAALSSSFIKNYKIPGVTSAGDGNSLYYRNGYVYLGLTATGGNGPVFHVVDVHDPTNPSLVGSRSIGGDSNDVNVIRVKNTYAYLASPYNDELVVLDIASSTSPMLIGNFSSSTGNGRSLALVGNHAYFGTTRAGTPELYALDIAVPTHLVSTDSEEIGASINGLIVRDKLAFLLLKAGGSNDGKLQIWNVSDPSNLTIEAMSALALPSGGTTHYSLDCEGNILYAGTNAVGDTGAISVIIPSP